MQSIGKMIAACRKTTTNNWKNDFHFTPITPKDKVDLNLNKATEWILVVMIISHKTSLMENVKNISIEPLMKAMW